MRRAVFLDRDGTLIEEAGYLDQLDRIRLFPYTIDAVRLLNRAGFAVVIVSNQSGVARGLFDEPFVAATQNRIAQLLAAGGAAIDAFYYCPHHPEGSVPAYRCVCDCRKPKPGQLRQAAADLDLAPDRSFVVGDRAGDVEAGLAFGAPGVLVRTGYGRHEEPRARLAAAAIADNLMEAVAWILRQP
jgi:D-glycero-D-manno-heptose 1,7-bisphosphate phosphatase